MSNLALPGSGSLAAGRVSGYAQLALALVGLGLSIVFGLKFILWYLANYSRLQGPDADPVASFQETLSRMRWAFGGMAVFAVGWLWALGTGMGILRRAHDPPRPDTPPPVQ